MKTTAKWLRHSLGCLVAVALPVLWTGCAGTPTHESTGEYIDDATITAKVKGEFARDPTVKGSQVSVETFKGVVQLSGFVDDPGSKRLAADLARRVNGVARVENNIIVKPVGGAKGGDLSDYSGEITAIDLDKNSLTVKKALISHTFETATGLEVVGRDRARSRFGELHVGDKVKVTYMEENGIKKATRIELTD